MISMWSGLTLRKGADATWRPPGWSSQTSAFVTALKSRDSAMKPVRARPGKGPGEYLVRLDLDMPGEWDVKLRLSAPVRDQVVLRYEFDERGGRPLRRHK